MRITCPDCAVQYEVPLRRLPADRKVRCAQCKAEWRVAPELRERQDRRPEAEPAWSAPRQGPPSRGPLLGWAVSLVFLGVVGAAVLHWRADVVRVWPPSGRILTVAGAAH